MAGLATFRSGMLNVMRNTIVFSLSVKVKLNTDICLVCFSTVVPKSLAHVTEKWISKIAWASFLLVSTQIKLKEDRATFDRLAIRFPSVLTWDWKKSKISGGCIISRVEGARSSFNKHLLFL